VGDLPGSGTEDDPYIITTATELQLINDDRDAHYKLGNDIDASDTATWNGGSGFEPIGDAPTQSGNNPDLFFGTLDGDGHTISGLTIDRPNENSVGLFSYVDRRASVENVRLTNADITGDEDVGGITGLLGGTVRNSSVDGTIDGSVEVGGLVGTTFNDITVTASNTSGEVNGSGSVGGLLGSNLGSVTKSYSTATVDGTAAVGGLIGTSFGTVNVSYATGDVIGADTTGLQHGYVGGLVGIISDEGIVEESYATGTVTGADDVSGFVGYIRDDGSMVTDSYWDTQTSGQTDSPGGTGLTTAEMTGEAAESNMNGFDFEANWEATDSYPKIKYDTGSEDPLIRFDQDNSGTIEFGEVLSTIAAYNNGSQIGGQAVTFGDVLAVISAYNDGTMIGS